MTDDFLDELGELALGSRLKRLSERMMSDAGSVYQHFGIDVQPKWFTLLALLDVKGSVSIVDAADALGLSQPAISQFSRQLQAKDFITLEADVHDCRKKHMRLSPQGSQAVASMQPVWRAVDRAAEDLCCDQQESFYAALCTFEQALARRSLLTRTLDHYHSDEDNEK